MSLTIYILYDHKESWKGVVSNLVRRVSATSLHPPSCPAYDLTHGGKAEETAEWKKLKSQIPAQVIQYGSDKSPQDINEYLAKNEVERPCVLARQEKGSIKLLMNEEDLVGLQGDEAKFLKKLEQMVKFYDLPWVKQATL